MKITIEIAKNCKAWSSCKEINKNLFKKIAKATLVKFPSLSKVAIFEISILLTDDEEMKQLNTEFRNKHTSTNVLSFPEIQSSKQLLEFPVDLDYIYLGDIAFAFTTIKRESEEFAIEFLDHFIHLLVHSLLHLLGFEHESNEDAAVMEAMEIEILKQFAISPYN